MYVSNFVRTVRRHWLLVLCGLLLTAGLCVAATVVVPPTYQAGASVLLLPPRSADGTGENQYLNLGGLQPTSDAVSRAMTDSSVQAQLKRAGAGGEYVINTDPTTNGPVLLVTVTDASREAALRTLRLVLAQLPRTLVDMQEKVSVPARSQMSSTVIAQDRMASLVVKSQLRVLAAAVGLGLAFTFGGVVFLESRDRQLEGTRRRQADAYEQTAIRVAGDVRTTTRPGRAEPLSARGEHLPARGEHARGERLLGRGEHVVRDDHLAALGEHGSRGDHLAARGGQPSAHNDQPVAVDDHRPAWSDQALAKGDQMPGRGEPAPFTTEGVPIRAKPRPVDVPVDIEHAETVRLPTWNPSIRTGDRTGSG